MSTVVAFPHGRSTTATKVFESTQVISDGAEEVDMVIDIARLRDVGRCLLSPTVSIIT